MAGLRFLCRLSGGLLAATLLASPAWAEAVLDGTTGSTGTFSGTFDIPAAVGRQEGGNLFHSFERFRVRRGESATFTGPGGIDNVIGRVTGGEISRINGRLASSVPGADFFFLNPSGVVFGPNASLDLPGSFHVSTADELRFEDGTAFSALAGGTGTFSAAAPAAFGFLGADAGDVTIDRSSLLMRPGETLSLSGGSLSITAGNQGTPSGGVSGLVFAPAGTIQLGAVRGAGSFEIASGDISAEAGGRILLADEAFLAVQGDGAGAVRIRGGRLVMENRAAVTLVNGGARDSERGIVVETDGLRLRNGSLITTTSAASGDAGQVRIRAQDLRLSGVSAIGSVGASDGAVGDVSLDTNELNLSSGSGIITSGLGTGGGGSIRIMTDRLSVDGSIIGAPSIATQLGIPAGRAGSVRIDATDSITVRNPGGIATLTNSEQAGGALTLRARRLVIENGALVTSGTIGTGAAGSVDVAVDRLDIGAGGQLQANSGEPGTLDAGPAGSLRVEAGRINIRNGGRISSDTFGRGNAGTVTVQAGRLRAEGGAAADARISSSTFGSADDAGDGGIIVVRADDIRLLGGGRIIGVTQGDGDSGAITVEAATMIIDGNRRGFFTGISSDAERALDDQGRPIPGAADATGDAGPLLVRVADLVLRDGGQIRSETGTRGDAGAVIVDSTESVEMSGGRSTSISSDAARGSSGDAGNVLVSTQTLLIGDGTRISSRTRGEGRAGQVLVVSEDGVVRGGIETTSRTLAPAGNVAFSAPRLVIEDGGLVGSSGLGDGPAGDVVLAGGELTVKDGAVRTEGREGGRINVAAGERLVLSGAEVTSNGIVPSAGDSIITVQSGTILVNSSSVTSLTGQGEPITGSGEARLLGDLTVISTDSRVAASSTLEVTGLESDLTAGVEVLPAAYIDVSGLLRESCAARAADQTSSFASEGGRALAPDPGAPLAGRYAADEAGPRATPAAFHHWTLSSVGGCHD